jgi:hypothetical protein
VRVARLQVRVLHQVLVVVGNQVLVMVRQPCDMRVMRVVRVQHGVGRMMGMVRMTRMGADMPRRVRLGMRVRSRLRWLRVRIRGRRLRLWVRLGRLGGVGLGGGLEAADQR